MERTRQIEWIMSDWYRRANYASYDKKTTLAHFFIKNRYSPIYLRSILYSSLCRWSNAYSKTEQRNMCRISGRSHYVVSKAGMARLQLRFFAGQGLLKGVNRTGL